MAPKRKIWEERKAGERLTRRRSSAVDGANGSVLPDVREEAEEGEESGNKPTAKKRKTKLTEDADEGEEEDNDNPPSQQEQTNAAAHDPDEDPVERRIDELVGDDAGEALRNYVRSFLMDEDADFENQACDVVEQLIEQNGKDDEAWQNPPNVWFFTRGVLPGDLDLPMDPRRLRALWSWVREHLHGARPAMMELFDRMFTRGKLLQHLMPIPPVFETTVANDYITQLYDLYVTTLKESYRRDFEDHINNEEAEEGAVWYRDLRDRMLATEYSARAQEPPLPYGALEAAWKESWFLVTRAFEEAAPSANCRDRYEAARSLAQDFYDSNLHLYNPRARGDGESLGEFCENLAEHVYGQHFARIQAEWTEYRDRLSVADEEAKADDDWLAVMRAHAVGDRLWCPDHTPEPGDRHRMSAATKEFMLASVPGRDHGPMGGFWTMEKVLGSGGFGFATLWIQVNNRNQIIDRVVTKDCYISLWNDTDYWDGPISARVPREYAITKQISDCAHAYNTIYCHNGFGLRTKLKVARMYLEHCEHGSLANLLSEHRRLADVKDSNGEQIEFRIPPRAVWSVFEALTSAVCLLQRGALPDSDPPARWVERVHLDIKPDNILLSKPDATIWPNIPIAKLADYGLADATSLERCKTAYGNGTAGFQAPEQQIYPNDNPNHNLFTITAQTDIWAIGRVILVLMNLETDPEAFTFDTAARWPRFNQGVQGHYGVNLCNLLKECLHKDPTRRPDIETLWNAVQKEVGQYKNLREPPMKSQQPPEDEILEYRLDVYALRMAA